AGATGCAPARRGRTARARRPAPRPASPRCWIRAPAPPAQQTPPKRYPDRAATSGPGSPPHATAAATRRAPTRVREAGGTAGGCLEDRQPRGVTDRPVRIRPPPEPFPQERQRMSTIGKHPEATCTRTWHQGAKNAQERLGFHSVGGHRLVGKWGALIRARTTWRLR